jgi:hypothetical protein
MRLAEQASVLSTGSMALPEALVKTEEGQHVG